MKCYYCEKKIRDTSNMKAVAIFIGGNKYVAKLIHKNCGREK